MCKNDKTMVLSSFSSVLLQNVRNRRERKEREREREEKKKSREEKKVDVGRSGTISVAKPISIL